MPVDPELQARFERIEHAHEIMRTVWQGLTLATEAGGTLTELPLRDKVADAVDLAKEYRDELAAEVEKAQDASIWNHDPAAMLKKKVIQEAALSPCLHAWYISHVSGRSAAAWLGYGGHVVAAETLRDAWEVLLAAFPFTAKLKAANYVFKSVIVTEWHALANAGEPRIIGAIDGGHWDYEIRSHRSGIGETYLCGLFTDGAQEVTF